MPACALSTPIRDQNSTLTDDLSLLARLHALPPSAALLGSLHRQGFPRSLGLHPCSPQGLAAMASLEGILGQTAERLTSSALSSLQHDHARLYLRPDWLQPDRVLLPSRRGDRLAQILNTIATLAGDEGHPALCRMADYLDETALPAILTFVQQSTTLSIGPFYPALAILTLAYADALREKLADVVERPRPLPAQQSVTASAILSEKVRL